MSGNAPPGIVAVLIDPNGNAVAHAADFDTYEFGGFSLKDCQCTRVEIGIARAMVDAYCRSEISTLIDDVEAEQLLLRARNVGFRLEFVQVGHGT